MNQEHQKWLEGLVDIHTICPLCRKENDDNYPVEVNGHIKEGGCQECWEKQCDEEWWKMVKTICQIKKSSRRSDAAIRKA